MLQLEVKYLVSLGVTAVSLGDLGDSQRSEGGSGGSACAPFQHCLALWKSCLAYSSSSPSLMCVCVHPDLPSMRCSSVRVVVPAPFLGEWTHINSLPQGEPLSDYRTDNGDPLNIVLNFWTVIFLAFQFPRVEWFTPCWGNCSFDKFIIHFVTIFHNISTFDQICYKWTRLIGMTQSQML